MQLILKFNAYSRMCRDNRILLAVNGAGLPYRASSDDIVIISGPVPSVTI
ncbi:hypothetical protein M5E06_28185 [Azospirillum sp. A1-3]|nr:hypothetical protein [Azospirillum sp. A1-3]MCM8738008.1 hypothetical protein [Azospirillum sp. A1-3]